MFAPWNPRLALRDEIQILVDVAGGGTLMAKILEVAKQIIEKMSSNFHWRDKRNTKKGGKYEVDALLAIQNSVHALSRRMDQLSVGNTLKAFEVVDPRSFPIRVCSSRIIIKPTS